MALQFDSILNNEQIPPTSPWTYLFSSKFIWKFNDEHDIRVNFTKDKFLPYHFCNCLIIFAYFILYKFLIQFFDPNDPTKQTRHLIILAFLTFMTVLCYAFTHYTNPGILPYYWSESKQRVYTQDELRSGIAINKNQIDYAKAHDYPPRSFFSGKYGAIILRADHWCTGVAHWIGLKNHRYFVQSHLYCAAFGFELAYILFVIAKNPNGRSIKNAIFWIPLMIYAICIIISQCTNIKVIFTRIIKNQTMIETLMKIDIDLNFYDRGIIKNFEEIFGSIYLFPLWFFPIPLPLPNDGFGYAPRPNDPCFAKNRHENLFGETKIKKKPLMIMV